MNQNPGELFSSKKEDSNGKFIWCHITNLILMRVQNLSKICYQSCKTKKKSWWNIKPVLFYLCFIFCWGAQFHTGAIIKRNTISTVIFTYNRAHLISINTPDYKKYCNQYWEIKSHFFSNNTSASFQCLKEWHSSKQFC